MPTPVRWLGTFRGSVHDMGGDADVEGVTSSTCSIVGLLRNLQHGWDLRGPRVSRDLSR